MHEMRKAELMAGLTFHENTLVIENVTDFCSYLIQTDAHTLTIDTKTAFKPFLRVHGQKITIQGRENPNVSGGLKLYPGQENNSPTNVSMLNLRMTFKFI